MEALHIARKSFKTTVSRGKVMEAIFWDIQWIIFVDFQDHLVQQ
jgi:hypothetical protein